MYLTFDVELYGPLRASREFLLEQERIWSRVLDLLDKWDVRVTHFVTWEFACAFPDTLRRMAKDGHEIASHTMTHRPFLEIGRQEFENEVSESKRLLEREAGGKVVGFRSPYGQVPADLGRMLMTHGYEYDSSIAATYVPKRFTGLMTPKHAYSPSLDNIRRSGPDLPFRELPISVTPWLPLPLGGFFLSGLSPLVWALPRMRRDPPIMFLHPYDFVDLRRYNGSLIWDKYKITGNNWRMLNYFLAEEAREDTRLIRLVRRVSGNASTNEPDRTNRRRG